MSSRRSRSRFGVGFMRLHGLMSGLGWGAAPTDDHRAGRAFMEDPGIVGKSVGTQLDGVVVERGEVPMPLAVFEHKRKAAILENGAAPRFPVCPGRQHAGHRPGAGLRPLIYGSSKLVGPEV